MKNFLKKIIFFIIKAEARIVLLRYRPKIIAITGTVGKTTTKDAIFKALSKSLHVRKNNKSMNSEIGVPLTILGLETGWNNPLHWISNVFWGFVQIIYYPKYPKWLVLEVGIDRPGDMKKTASWIRPDVAVITAFGQVPVHVEFFEDPDGVTREEADLINYLKKDGVIILNADDEKALKLKSHAKNKVYTYARDSEADITASHYSVLYKNNLPAGISFKVNYGGNSIPILLNGVIGDQYVYPILAAISVGVALEFSPVLMSEGLSDFRPPKGRMNLIPGDNETILIDDSYNSSPMALSSAVNNLGQIKNSGQKIAILGDMTEIGRFSASEHRKIGSLIVQNKIDILITAGPISELILEQAREEGMPKSRTFHFKNSKDAIPKATEFLKPGNVFLIKGSQSTRMEKISKALLPKGANPAEFLVRQEKEWLER